MGQMQYTTNTEGDVTGIILFFSDRDAEIKRGLEQQGVVLTQALEHGFSIRGSEQELRERGVLDAVRMFTVLRPTVVLDAQIVEDNTTIPRSPDRRRG